MTSVGESLILRTNEVGGHFFDLETRQSPRHHGLQGKTHTVLLCGQIVVRAKLPSYSHFRQNTSYTSVLRKASQNPKAVSQKKTGAPKDNGLPWENWKIPRKQPKICSAAFQCFSREASQAQIHQAKST